MILKFDKFFEKLNNFLPLIIVLVIFFIIGIVFFYLWNNKKLFKIKKFFNKFLFFLKLKKLKKINFLKIKTKKLKKIKPSGLIIYSNKNKIYYDNNNHSIIIGSTGKGKSWKVLIPSLLFSILNKNNSFVISDLKGEIYNLLYKHYLNLGWKIKIIDPNQNLNFSNNQKFFFNPLLEILEKYQNNKNVDNLILKLIENVFSFKQEKQDFWSGSKNNILFPLIKFTLFYVIGEKKKYLKFNDIFNIFNFFKFSFNKFNEYLEPKNSKEKLILFQQIFKSQYNIEIEIIKKIYLKNQNDFLNLFDFFSEKEGKNETKNSILIMLENILLQIDFFTKEFLNSENGLEALNLKTKPTILFIIGSNFSNKIISFINYLIEKLFYYNFNLELFKKNKIKKTNKVFFALDEIANIFKLKNLSNYLSIARSEKIFFWLFLQSVEQLNKLYKINDTKIIISNCNNLLFLGSNEYSTIEHIIKKFNHFNFGLVFKSKNIFDIQNKKIKFILKTQPFLNSHFGITKLNHNYNTLKKYLITSKKK